MPKPSDMPGAATAFDQGAITREELADDKPALGEAGPEMFRTFTDQALAPIGIPTSDGRMFNSDTELSFRSTPLPLQWCEQNAGGHDMSYTVGVIEDIRLDGDMVLASGYILNTSHADDAMGLIEHGVSNPSLDLANADYHYVDKDGNKIEMEDLWDLMSEGDEYFTLFTKAEVIATTLVSTPAFDTRFSLDAERSSREVAIVASVLDEIKLATYEPSLFVDPKLTRPTRPTMDKNTGRIYGHLAEWGHAVRGGDGRKCPRNHNDYANFHTSQIMLDDGKQLAVGRLTVEGGHAPTEHGVSAATARAHYDNVARCFGLVRVGEDAHGIWFSGVPAPGVDPDVFQSAMTAPLSGDWRECGMGLDMIAVHAVNSPGFPIYSGATGPNGREVALVASFSVRDHKGRKAAGGFDLTRDNLKDLLVEVVETLDARKTATEVAEENRLAREAALARAAALNLPKPVDPKAAALERARGFVTDKKPGEVIESKRKKNKPTPSIGKGVGVKVK